MIFFGNFFLKEFSFFVIFVESGMFFAIFSAAESEMVAFLVTEVVESIFTFSFSGIVSVADTPPSFCLSPDVFELQAATKQYARKKRYNVVLFICLWMSNKYIICFQTTIYCLMEISGTIVPEQREIGIGQRFGVL